MARMVGRPASMVLMRVLTPVLMMVLVVASAASGCGPERKTPVDAGTDQNVDLGVDLGTGTPEVGAEARPARTFMFDENEKNELDLLFVVDNSPGMAPFQQKLIANFSTMMQLLENLPDGRPDLHIGVISTDMGAGSFTQIPGCRPGGDRGLLQATARTTGCPTPTDRYMTLTGDATNFEGTAGEVFACIAALGDGGCEFEHPLAALAAALDPARTPENAGFLREGTPLQIVILSNEDDCSAPSASPLFDPSSTHVWDTFGPFDSFRCNEYGHLCDGLSPPRSYEMSYLAGACTSNEYGMLTPVSEIVARLRTLATRPRAVFVSVIAGPTDPYAVVQELVSLPDGRREYQSRIAPSCALSYAPPSSPEQAAPAVRLNLLASSFGRWASFTPICAASFAAAVQPAVNSATERQPFWCLPEAPPDANPGAPGVQPDCEAFWVLPSTSAVLALPQCRVGDGGTETLPCATVYSAPETCLSRYAVSVHRASDPVEGTRVGVRCQ